MTVDELLARRVPVLGGPEMTISACSQAMRSDVITLIPVDQLEPNPWGMEVAVSMFCEDYDLLRLSIETEGVHVPLVVWSRGTRLVVIAGMNRLAIARELGIAAVPVIVREFADEHAAKLYALTDNLARRHLNTGQRTTSPISYGSSLRSEGGEGLTCHETVVSPGESTLGRKLPRRQECPRAR